MKNINIEIYYYAYRFTMKLLAILFNEIFRTNNFYTLALLNTKLLHSTNR